MRDSRCCRDAEALPARGTLSNRLRELVRETTEELVSARCVLAPTRRDFRTQRLEAPPIANGCFWGEPSHDDAWSRRIGVRAPVQVLFPQALLRLYVRIAAVAKGRYELAHSSVASGSYEASNRSCRSRIPRHHHRGSRARSLPTSRSAYLASLAHINYKVPLSQSSAHTETDFADLIPADQDYTDAFDRFECLACLVHQDLFGFELRGYSFRVDRQDLADDPERDRDVPRATGRRCGRGSSTAPSSASWR